MAGWSRIDDGSVVDCAKTPKKRFKPNGFWVQLDLARPEEGVRGVEREPFEATEAESDKYRCWFERLLGFFLKEICTAHSYRSIPPMLGDERYVDLFKLFLAVREKGGYDAVSRNKLWDSVTKEIGLSSKLSPSVKLVYCKYLEVLEGWLGGILENRGSGGSLRVGGVGISEGLMDLEAEFKGFLSEISDLKKKDEEVYSHLDVPVNSAGESNVAESCGVKECVDGRGDLGLDGSVNLQSVGNLDDGNEVKSVAVGLDGAKENDDLTAVDPNIVAEGSFGCKRKREDMLGMLNWVNGVAKNPCDSVIGYIPDRSKWKACANDVSWKQVLLVRQALFQKRDVDLSAEQSILQKNHKMHPAMYDDHLGSSYNLRERMKCRRKLLPEETTIEGQACSESSSSGTQSDMENSQSSSITGVGHIDMLDGGRKRKRIPVGHQYQVEIPEWTGAAYESDCKWLGVRVWPLEKSEPRFLIERDPIGKGRQDSCGCQAPGSYECVKFHIAEKRYKVKLELGSAFHHWKFNKMGEEVVLSWGKDEEKKFDSIVRANPVSLGKRFWDPLIKSLPGKRREDLVSYYFNVFLLRRRGFQNRFTPVDLNSDDDDADAGSNGSEHETVNRPGSIFYSPNKPHSNCR